jgi:hypothetical protein
MTVFDWRVSLKNFPFLKLYEDMLDPGTNKGLNPDPYEIETNLQLCTAQGPRDICGLFLSTFCKIYFLFRVRSNSKAQKAKPRRPRRTRVGLHLCKNICFFAIF